MTVTGAVTARRRPEPLSSSFAVKVTVTSALFQSSAFGAGLSVWVTVGAMLSHFRATLVGRLGVAGVVDRPVLDRAGAGAGQRDATVLVAPAATCSAPPSTL